MVRKWSHHEANHNLGLKCVLGGKAGETKRKYVESTSWGKTIRLITGKANASEGPVGLSYLWPPVDR